MVIRLMIGGVIALAIALVWWRLLRAVIKKHNSGDMVEGRREY